MTERRARKWGGHCLFAVLLVAVMASQAIAAAETAVQAWVRRYSNENYGSPGGEDFARKIVVDSCGNVFVAGRSADDIVVIKYSGAGEALWTNRYDGPVHGEDGATAIAVDSSGNIFVSGYSRGTVTSDDYATIKYSAAGVPLWTNRYNGPANGNDEATAIAVDSSGNVFVAGYSQRGYNEYDYATIAYSVAGAPLWTNRFDGAMSDPDGSLDNSGEPAAIAVNSSGNVFVTGKSASGSYTTIAYSPGGEPIWTNRYGGATGSAKPTAIAVDSSGNVFVTGQSSSGSSSLYATIAYSAAGGPLWTNRYHGPTNGIDGAKAIAVDSSGNVFVTGYSLGNRSGYDYATIKYSGAGVALWTNRYDGGFGADTPAAIAVDSSGNAVVTGHSSGSGSGDDYATIKYSSVGVPLWTNRYDAGFGGDYAAAIGVDSSGNVFVTGFSNGPGNDFDYVTVKYVTVPELAVQPRSSGASEVNLTLRGAADSDWLIERAPRITGPWTNLGPVRIQSGGSVPFRDTSPTAPAAFYRAHLPQWP